MRYPLGWVVACHLALSRHVSLLASTWLQVQRLARLERSSVSMWWRAGFQFSQRYVYSSIHFQIREFPGLLFVDFVSTEGSVSNCLPFRVRSVCLLSTNLGLRGSNSSSSSHNLRSSVSLPLCERKVMENDGIVKVAEGWECWKQRNSKKRVEKLVPAQLRCLICGSTCMWMCFNGPSWLICDSSVSLFSFIRLRLWMLSLHWLALGCEKCSSGLGFLQWQLRPPRCCPILHSFTTAPSITAFSISSLSGNPWASAGNANVLRTHGHELAFRWLLGCHFALCVNQVLVVELIDCNRVSTFFALRCVRWWCTRWILCTAVPVRCDTIRIMLRSIRSFIITDTRPSTSSHRNPRHLTRLRGPLTKIYFRVMQTSTLSAPPRLLPGSFLLFSASVKSKIVTSWHSEARLFSCSRCWWTSGQSSSGAQKQDSLAQLLLLMNSISSAPLSMYQCKTVFMLSMAEKNSALHYTTCWNRWCNSQESDRTFVQNVVDVIPDGTRDALTKVWGVLVCPASSSPIHAVRAKCHHFIHVVRTIWLDVHGQTYSCHLTHVVQAITVCIITRHCADVLLWSPWLSSSITVSSATTSIASSTIGGTFEHRTALMCSWLWPPRHDSMSTNQVVRGRESVVCLIEKTRNYKSEVGSCVSK